MLVTQASFGTRHVVGRRVRGRVYKFVSIFFLEIWLPTHSVSVSVGVVYYNEQGKDGACRRRRRVGSVQLRENPI